MDSSDPNYPGIIFELYGLAVADLGSKQMLIDGDALAELSDDHLLAIEAHEVSHGRLLHCSRDIGRTTQEKEADWLAHKTLLEMNLMTPATILSQRYKEHYGEDISSLDDYMSQILPTLQSNK